MKSVLNSILRWGFSFVLGISIYYCFTAINIEVAKINTLESNINELLRTGGLCVISAIGIYFLVMETTKIIYNTSDSEILYKHLEKVSFIKRDDENDGKDLASYPYSIGFTLIFILSLPLQLYIVHLVSIMVIEYFQLYYKLYYVILVGYATLIGRFTIFLGYTVLAFKKRDEDIVKTI